MPRESLDAKLQNSRVNIDALGAVVDGHTQELAAIRTQIAGVGDRMGAAIDALSDKMDARAEDQYKQQQATFASSKPDWKGALSAAAAVAAVFVTVFVVIGSMALSPIREAEVDAKADAKTSIDLQQRRNLAMDAANAKVADELVATRIAQAEAFGRGIERHDAYLRDAARIEAHIGALDAALLRTQGDAVKELQQQLSQMRAGGAPTVPAKP
jgi:hypothetical protein